MGILSERMQCPSCGIESSPQALLCANCGTSLEAGRPVTGVRRPVFQVLSDRNYRSYFPAVVATQIARWMWLLATGFLVLRLTDSTLFTQMVGVATAAPLIPVGITMGMFGDAFDRRRILLAALLVDITVAATATLLVVSGTVAAWHLIALSFVVGSSLTVDQITRRALVMDLIGRELLPYGIGLDSLAFMGGIMIGPLVAGLLIDLLPESNDANIAIVYGTMTACFSAALFLLRNTRPRARKRLLTLGVRAIFTSLAEGFRVVASNRAIIGVFGVTLLFNIAFPPHHPLIPVFAEKVLHVGPAALGVLGAASGSGALLGLALILSRREIRRKSSYYILGGLICVGFLFVFGISKSYPLSVAALFMAGIGFSGINSMQPTLILLSVDESVRARVLGIHTIVIGVVPLSSLMVGTLAELWGPGEAVAVVALTCFLLMSVWVPFAKEMRRL